MLGVSHLADRKPGEALGGRSARGEHRAGVARDPAILFLDEPIAALDPPTRRSLVDDLLQVLDSRGIAAVWVTHDRDEALAVGDSVTFIERERSCSPAPRWRCSPGRRPSRSRTSSASTAISRGPSSPGKPASCALSFRAVSSCGVARRRWATRSRASLREDVVLLTTVPDQSTSLRNVLQGTVRAGARPDGRLLRVDVVSEGIEVAALVTKASFEGEAWASAWATGGGRLQGGRRHPIPRRSRTGN